MDQPYRPNISWNWRGDSKAYFVTLDGEEVHRCETPYERDMFIAELKMRFRMLSCKPMEGKA